MKATIVLVSSGRAERYDALYIGIADGVMIIYRIRIIEKLAPLVVV